MSIVSWLKDSHRIQHLALGVVAGLGADDWYCAIYGGVGIGGALEFKDWQWGGKPSLIDFLLTFAGVMIGFTIRYFVLKWLR